MTTLLKRKATNRIAAGIAALLVTILGLPGDRLFLGGAAQAQDQAPTAPSIVTVSVPRADQAALPNMVNILCHILPIQEGHGGRAPGQPPTRPGCDT
jgi:hypothetical protein